MRFQFGPVTLIPDERVLLQDGQPVSLTPKAFEFFAFLAANPGRLLTKDELLQAVWPDAVVEESNLAYTVFAIRKALGESPESARYIETVPKPRIPLRGAVVRDEPNVDRARLTEPAVSLLRFQEQWWGRPSEPPSISLSPDGRHLVLGAEGPDGVPRLWVRTLSESSPPGRCRVLNRLTSSHRSGLPTAAFSRGPPEDRSRRSVSPAVHLRPSVKSHRIVSEVAGTVTTSFC